MTKKETVLDFNTALKFPFNRAVALLNILWYLLPIFGWFAVGGYSIRIVQGFVAGKFKELPEMHFGSDMKFGFFMFIKSIPFVIALIIVSIILGIIPIIGAFLNILISILLVPILTINFFKKETVESYFEFKLIQVVFDNLGDYILAILKSIGLGLIFLVMFIVLVGIPANAFTKNIFIADFYRRKVK